MRALITGVAGFVGTWLAEHLVEHHPEVEVWGLDRWDASREGLRGVERLVRFVAADLADASSLLRALQAARPEVLFHLAASSTVSSSWSTPAEILQVNAVGQVHLLEAVRSLQLGPAVIHNRGRDVAVLMRVEDYARVGDAAAASMAVFLRDVAALKQRYGGGEEFDPEPACVVPRAVFRRGRRA